MLDPLTEATDFSGCAVRCWGHGQDAPVPAAQGPFGVRWTWSKEKGNAQGIVETSQVATALILEWAWQ